MKANRYAWVDYAKGICIIGVVTLYVADYMTMQMGSAGWMVYWTDFARPFRMPDFFLLSGLFLARVIDRPWRDYLDTKVVHYLYFYVLWTTIFFAARVATEGTAAAESGQPDESLVAWILWQPFAMLWFIQALPIMFLVTRLTRRVPWWLMLGAAALLQMFPLPSSGFVQIGHFCARFVYFYVGYAFASYVFRMADGAIERPRAALIGVLIWGVTNAYLVQTGWSKSPGISLVLGLVGTGAVITVGTLLSRIDWMDWLRYLGQHSIVTYLGFFLPMQAFLKIAQTVDVIPDPGTLAALISILSVLCGMVLFWATRNTWASFLFKRPEWAHIPGVALKRRPAASVAAD
jgi:uncharacterized membrane protein YcfT